MTGDETWLSSWILKWRISPNSGCKLNFQTSTGNLKKKNNFQTEKWWQQCPGTEIEFCWQNSCQQGLHQSFIVKCWISFRSWSKTNYVRCSPRTLFSFITMCDPTLQLTQKLCLNSSTGRLSTTPPYIPDLAPSSNHLFNKMKTLKSTRRSWMR